MFRFLLTFFGLTPDYRAHLFRQIHEIVFHGQGGYDWETIYDMPIWLRKITFNLIKEYYDKQNEEIENQQNILNNKKEEISRPDIPLPDYVAKKAPKK